MLQATTIHKGSNPSKKSDERKFAGWSWWKSWNRCASIYLGKVLIHDLGTKNKRITLFQENRVDSNFNTGWRDCNKNDIPPSTTEWISFRQFLKFGVPQTSTLTITIICLSRKSVGKQKILILFNTNNGLFYEKNRKVAPLNRAELAELLKNNGFGVCEIERNLITFSIWSRAKYCKVRVVLEVPNPITRKRWNLAICNIETIETTKHF